MKKRLQVSLLLCLVAMAGWGQPIKHILLEEFSTAPCGFCPDGDIIAAQLVGNYPDVIWVTHHAGFGTDSMTVPGSIPIAGAFTTFAPGACIDRGDYPIPVYTIPPYIAVSRQKWDSIVVAHLNDPPVAEITITNNYDSIARTLDCAVDISFMDAPAPGDLRLNLYLVEDSVVGFGPGYDQKNYLNTTPGHPYYQAGDPIVGYVHHRVVRHIEGGAWGLPGIIPPAPQAGSSYSHSYAGIPVSPGWKDDDMEVVAFVSYDNVDPKKRQVVNAGRLHLKDYTTDIAQAAKPQSIRLFPNPANDYFFLASDGEAGWFSLSEYTGRVVRTVWLDTGVRSHQMVTASLTAGVYLYSFVNFNGERTATGKLSIVR